MDLDAPLSPKSFKPTEIVSLIKTLPPKKAPGYDLITSEILENVPPIAILFLLYIFNAVLRTTPHFPTFWKFSIVKLIQKPSKPTHLPSSYRPVSLLSSLGKVLEKLLLHRIDPIIISGNIILDHQVGFRTQHSTIQQCFRVLDSLYSWSSTVRRPSLSSSERWLAVEAQKNPHGGPPPPSNTWSCNPI